MSLMHLIERKYACQRASCAAILPLGAHGIEQFLHAPAQSMHLIEQVKNNRDAFIVHAEVVAKIADELRSGEVDVRECKLGVRLRRDQPSGSDPSFQRVLVEASA